MINETAKSTSGEIILDSGIIRRGKYTLVMMLAFVTMLVVDRVSPSAKRVQGSRAASTKRGYGTPSDGIFASPPKKIVKMTMVRSGWRTAHAIPRPVCLYRSLISRSVNEATSSRYAHSSCRSTGTHFRGGRMTRVGTVDS